MPWKTFLSILFSIIAISLMAVYLILPFDTIQFYGFQKPSSFNFSINDSNAQMQFYENMRFPNSNISYDIEGCPLQKKYEMEQAFKIISNISSLKFYPVQNEGEISVTCEERARVENGLFIAGEGGPVKITNTTSFNVILHGEILLIRESDCQNPNIAIHELLHALGFNHSQNPGSIMYNVTNCDQQIGEDIIKKIDILYSVPSHPDLSIENSSAFMHGKYLDANITIRNQGLADSKGGKLVIYADGKVIEELEISEMKIGYGTEIFVTNILVLKLTVNELKFFIDYSGSELEKSNNEMRLKIKE